LKKNVVFIGGSGLIGSELINDKDINVNFNCINFDLVYKKNSFFYKTDASKQEQLKKSIIKVLKRFGNIYAVVNCVYPKVLQRKELPNINANKFLREINNHFGIYLNVIQCFAKFFDKDKISKIINFSSIYGSITPKFEIYRSTSISTMPLQYSIIKNAINTMMVYSAKFFLKKKIKINNISPGGVLGLKENKKFIANYGKFTSSGTLLNKKDVTKIVFFLLSSGSDKITGQNIVIDDGFSL
jgi:NAD(P)-dependent dehydrogenase (short-subunit alcohol dehydrogenase family)